MKSGAYSANDFGLLRHRESSLASRSAAYDEDWAMLKLLTWIATFAILGFLIWQTAAAAPIWPPAVSAFLLIMVSVLAGLRLGADTVSAYTKDLQRLNNVIVQQNRELTEANALLLKQQSPESRSPSKSA